MNQEERSRREERLRDTEAEQAETTEGRETTEAETKGNDHHNRSNRPPKALKQTEAGQKTMTIEAD